MSEVFATHVVQQLVSAGYLAYWAGGCVRDLLRGETPHDFDVATNATPDQVRGVFGPRRSLPVGESFGVIIVLGRKGSGDAVEVATFRREGNYLDGRRPESVEFCSAEEDAGRRDFTINGMFYDPLTRVVHDYVGGQQDLQGRIVRAIGDPRARMTEDKLRMLRAVRFTANLNFELETATGAAIQEMCEQVLVVSAERIAQELRKMLAARTRARAMQLCSELGMLGILFPELHSATPPGTTAWDRRRQLLEGLGEAPFETALAALLRDVGQDLPEVERESQLRGICRRLRLSNDETRRICWLITHAGALETLPAAPPAQVKRLAVEPGFRELVHLEEVAAGVEGRDQQPYQWMRTFLQEVPWSEIDPPQLVSGRDLLDLGLPAGPAFKAWLIAIRDAQLNGAISTREEAIVLARQLAEPSPF